MSYFLFFSYFDHLGFGYLGPLYILVSISYSKLFLFSLSYMVFLCMLSIYIITFLTVFIILLSATYGILLLVSFSRVYQVPLDLFSYIFFLDFSLIKSTGFFVLQHEWVCMFVYVYEMSLILKKILSICALAPHWFISDNKCSFFLGLLYMLTI